MEQKSAVFAHRMAVRSVEGKVDDFFQEFHPAKSRSSFILTGRTTVRRRERLR